MNWRDFLSLATRLAAATTEADWRTAVSRAYYAAFHVARRLLTDLNFTVPRADRAHQSRTRRAVRWPANGKRFATGTACSASC
jgi:hypothetical protein